MNLKTSTSSCFLYIVNIRNYLSDSYFSIKKKKKNTDYISDKQKLNHKNKKCPNRNIRTFFYMDEVKYYLFTIFSTSLTLLSITNPLGNLSSILFSSPAG